MIWSWLVALNGQKAEAPEIEKKKGISKLEGNYLNLERE